MDTGILARIIQDIQSDENKFAFQATFQNILAALKEQTQETVQVEQSKLQDNLNQSILSGYVKTDYEALGALGVEDFFGLGSFTKLESILSLNPLAAQDALTTYITDRQAAISKIEALRSTLSSFDLQPRVLGADEYEIGFSFPDQYKDIGKFNKALSDINNFLNELSAAKKQGPFKIAYVSNGTIEIFIHAAELLAHDFDLVATHIVDICGFYHIAKELNEKIQHYPPKWRKQGKTANNGARQDEVNASVEDLMNSLEIKDRLARDRVKGLFVGLIEHISEGVFAEVRAPALPPPAEPPADATPADKKAFDLKQVQYQTKLNIDKTNKEIYLLEQGDIKGSLKLLSGQVDEEEIAGE